MAIHVVKAGAHFALSDAALGMFRVAQQIQGDAPNQCKVRCRVLAQHQPRLDRKGAHQVNRLAVGLTIAAKF